MARDYNLILAMPTLGSYEEKNVRDSLGPLQQSVGKHGEVVETLVIQPWELEEDSDDEIDEEDLENWREYFKRLNEAARSRLVLLAHGSYTRMADKLGWQIAKALVRILGLQKVGRISVVACWAGGPPRASLPAAAYNPDVFLPASAHYPPTVKCFAQELHYKLGRKYGVRTEVTARTGVVDVKEGGRREVWFPDAPGARPSTGNGQWKHHAPGSKYLWYWQNDEQRVKEVIYPEIVRSRPSILL